MAGYILKRLLFLIPTILGVTVLIFSLARLVPADPARLALGVGAMEDQVVQYRAEMGLDKPLVTQYFIYMKNLLKGDLGQSISTRRAVAEDLKSYFPATVELLLFSLFFATLFGIALGVLAAVKQNQKTDHVLRAVSVAGVSFPEFWVGVVLLLVFYIHLDLAPGAGRIDPKILLTAPFKSLTGFYLIDSLLAGNIKAFMSCAHHLILPGICLGFSPLARIARVTRSSMLDVLQTDYIMACRAKGMSEWGVVLKHGLRNALNPIITIFFLSLGYAFGGAVLVEKIFAWPGMGRYAFMAASNVDYNAIQGVTLIVVIAIMLSNLAADILYSVADPEIVME
jgi:peptide/nickel transport system permease protein